MDANPDYCDLLSEFNAASVRYLVIGAHALAYHAEPRFTKDIDVWVHSAAENARRVWAALRKFGAPLKGIGAADFSVPDMVYQMGMPPNRVDVLTSVAGVRFANAWRRRVRVSYGGVGIFVMSRTDLIRNKRACGRPQDLLDVKQLVAGTRGTGSRARKRTRRSSGKRRGTWRGR